jgi:hypothetical protein
MKACKCRPSGAAPVLVPCCPFCHLFLFSLTSHTHSLTHSLTPSLTHYIFIPPLKLHHFATAFTSLLLGLPQHNRQHSRVCRVTHVTSRHVTLSLTPQLRPSRHQPSVVNPSGLLRSSERASEVLAAVHRLTGCFVRYYGQF